VAITLDLVPTDEHDKITAIAAVTDNTGRPRKALVKFYDGTTFKKSSVVDIATGTATVELKLTVGVHVVRAEISGTGDFQEQEIEVSTPDERELGPVDWFLMLAFWVSLIIWGPGTWALSLIHLIFAVGLTVVVARMRGKSAGESLLGENNWVFFSVMGMVGLCGLMAWLNPLLPRPKGAAFFDFMRSTSHEFGIGRHFVWRIINKVFMGKALTKGWAHAAFAYGTGWFLFSGFVSFRDNIAGWWKEFRKKRLAGGGWSKLLEHGWYEILFEGLGGILKAILKGAAGK